MLNLLLGFIAICQTPKVTSFESHGFTELEDLFPVTNTFRVKPLGRHLGGTSPFWFWASDLFVDDAGPSTFTSGIKVQQTKALAGLLDNKYSYGTIKSYCERKPFVVTRFDEAVALTYCGDIEDEKAEWWNSQSSNIQRAISILNTYRAFSGGGTHWSLRSGIACLTLARIFRSDHTREEILSREMKTCRGKYSFLGLCAATELFRQEVRLGDDLGAIATKKYAAKEFHFLNERYDYQMFFQGTLEGAKHEASKFTLHLKNEF